MAQLPSAFNSQQHDDMNDFSIVPKGDYVMSIIKSSLDLTKAAKESNDPSMGQMLKMQLKIITGKYKNKIVFAQLNIINKNPIAVEIAQKELATICRACGKHSIQDSAEIHGIPMLVTLDAEESPDYPDKNICVMYKSAAGTPIPDDPPQSMETRTATSEPATDAGTETKKARPWD